jgi:hypothetical protein
MYYHTKWQAERVFRPLRTSGASQFASLPSEKTVPNSKDLTALHVPAALLPLLLLRPDLNLGGSPLKGLLTSCTCNGAHSMPIQA